MKKYIFVIVATIMVMGLLLKDEVYGFYEYRTSTQTLSYYGSRGDEVINIQSRLKKWGYYKGSIDGVYGYNTYKAVRLFQYKNNLTVDGVAGPETLSALGLPSGRSTSTYTSARDKDVDLLAHLVHGEARGEPYIGQVAVAAVVLNRVKDPRFPKTIASVIYEPLAFTAVADGQINLEPDASSLKAARDALNGWDPSGKAYYYFNPVTATSKWIWSRPQIKKIGKHIFCK